MAETTRFEDWEAEQMQDAAFREAVQKQEVAYQVARFRMLRGLTQEQLAEMASTRQSGIARLESGRKDPSLSFLRRVAKAMGGRVEIRIVADEAIEVVRDPESADTETEYEVVSAPRPLHRVPVDVRLPEGATA